MCGFFKLMAGAGGFSQVFVLATGGFSQVFVLMAGVGGFSEVWSHRSPAVRRTAGDGSQKNGAASAETGAPACGAGSR